MNDKGYHNMYITICPIVILIKIRRINDRGRMTYLTISIIIINGIIVIGQVGTSLYLLNLI